LRVRSGSSRVGVSSSGVGVGSGRVGIGSVRVKCEPRGIDIPLRKGSVDSLPSSLPSSPCSPSSLTLR
jgi:hypothetical protein